eukprot:s490_g5.t1
MQLLPRLASYRGRWQNDRLEGALAEAIEHLRTEIAPESGIALAVALLLGGRLTMAATGGAVCMIFGQVGQSDGNVDNLEVVGSSETTDPRTHCAVLEDSHLGALLTVNSVRSSGLSAARMRALARSHTMGDRPRAGCVSLLEEAQKAGAQPPLVAAAVRFSWSRNQTVKKQRTDPSNLTKVRCRHLLLRYVGCQAPLGDRRKKPTRSSGDAELQILRILPEVAHGGAAAFTKKCKELSECDTAMKSGDLAGDLGWLDKDPAKNRKVPAAVVRAAHGLPEVARGAVVVSSAFSVLVSTAGLALLRGTRPSEVERLQRYADAGSPIQQWILWHILGVFGALLLYIGLVLSSIPMLMGVSADDEGKAAAIAQQTLVLVCWLTERYLVEGRPLPLMQSCLCALIWFGSSVVEWAGPRPYDNMSLGLPGQIAGCDGGYRSPFLIYASVWLTGLTFGTLLLFVEEGTTLVSCVDPSDDEAQAADPAQEKTRKLQPFRRKALPIVYAMATSMSGIVFATGTAGNDMRYVMAGAVLLVIAVLCAWDFLWRLELPISTWGAVFQGFTTSLRVVQSHFVFRDFRWDPEDMHGILIVYKFPGLQFFMTGMFVLFVSLQLYMYTCSWPEWSIGEQVHTSVHLSSLSRDTRAESLDDGSSFVPGRLCRGSRLWQWLLLPFCMFCIIVGTHIPLIQTEFTLPDIKWLHDAEAIQRFEANHTPGYGHRFTDGDAYIDVITWLYDSRLPCSAFVVSYNAMILPPVQFLLFFFILLRPSFIPEELYSSMQAYVMNLAPMRFTQPCIMMLIVGIANMPGPGDTLFGGWFTHGYWYFIAYCMSAILLAWSVQPSEEDPGKYAAAEEALPCEGLHSAPGSHRSNGSNGVHKDGDSARALMAKYKQHATGNGNGNGDDDSDELSEASDGGDVCAKRPFEVAACVVGACVVVATAYLALTQTFLNMQYRLSVEDLVDCLTDLGLRVYLANLLSPSPCAMGVPTFFRWICVRYPKVIRDTIEREPVEMDGRMVPVDLDEDAPNGDFDNLYLDMNGIIHPCCHPEDGPAPVDEEHMYENIFLYLDRLFRIVRPKRLVYMAIDGVAPRAKMNQQRARRFRAAQEREEMEREQEKLRQDWEAEGRTLPNRTAGKVFDSNVITPGTNFLHKMSEAIRYYIHDRTTNDPLWQKLKFRVLLSDAAWMNSLAQRQQTCDVAHIAPRLTFQEPLLHVVNSVWSALCEGEHKIMQFIRLQRAQPDYDPNTRHCLYGADADLIMLGLATHEAHFSILREVIIPKSEKKCTLCGGTGHVASECTGEGDDADDSMAIQKLHAKLKPFQIVSLPVLRQYLQLQFTELVERMPPTLPYNFERCVDDFVFMCFFVGNDFLPHLPSLSIRDGSIDQMMALYVEILPSLEDYLTDCGRTNLMQVEQFLEYLGGIEDQVFKHRLDRESKMRAEKEAERAKATKEEVSLEPSGAEQMGGSLAFGGSSNSSFMAPKEEASDTSAWHAQLLAQSFSMDFENLDSQEPPAKRARQEELDRALRERLNNRQDLGEAMADTVRLGEGPHWKQRYYFEKFKDDLVDFLQRIRKAYVEGLCWVLVYYYQGCPSWTWFYPYHYAPFASDLIGCGNLKPGQPFQPFQQLMSVLPPVSAEEAGIPAAMRELMKQSFSPLIDFYPVDFGLDLNGKREMFQAAAICARLCQMRNRHGEILVFGHKQDKALFHAVQLAQAAFEAGHAGLKQNLACMGWQGGGANREVASPIEGLPDVEESHCISAQYTEPEVVPHSSELLPGISEQPLVVNAADMDDGARNKGFGGDAARKLIMQALGKDGRRKRYQDNLEGQ